MTMSIRFLANHKLPQGHGGPDDQGIDPNPAANNPARLEELARQAKSYALHMMRSTGGVPPAMIAATANGFIFCQPTEMPEEAAHEWFSDLARSLVIAHNARAIVMVAEAWVMPAAPAIQPGFLTRPSLAPDPQEMVVLLLEDQACSVTGLLPILRGSSGMFRGFGHSPPLEGSSVTGCFTGLIPSHVPGAGEVAMARAELRRFARCVVRQGFDPSLN